jgi:DNA-binding NtrC family response regulator
MKILIVDDEPTILMTLSHLLNNKDTTVNTSSGAQEAEEALSRFKYDLVITDLRLSGSHGTEGLELLSYIKNCCRETEVIIMTGFGSDSIREDAYKRGALAYFEKPIDIANILSSVEQVAAGKRAFP